MNRRLAPGLVFLLISGFLAAQSIPPVSENVVVSAGLAPETEPAVSAAVTVITRDQIEKSGRTDVLELLREVPGVDVVRSGGSGTVTSVFLRGANSNHTLVLVDGVRVNDPNSGGYDFSALSTQNVERIEITRGPFSALYGSDAIGGVVSILTRPISPTPEGRATAAAGNASSRQATLFASAGTGDFGLSLSGRSAHDGGDVVRVAGADVDNSAWRSANGTAHLQWSPSPNLQAGLEVDRTTSKTEIPSDGAVATPDNYSEMAQTTWILPIAWTASDTNSVHAAVSSVDARPLFYGPDGLYPDTSRIHTNTRAVRLADTWSIAGQTISAAASYEDSKVDSSDDFGVQIDGRRIHTGGIAAEDRISLAEGRLTVVGGVRYDHHSAYGSSTNPRVSLVYSLTAADAVRASFGTAFHAPTIADLYYPFFGNPNLRPEKSRSFEIGYTRRAGSLEADVALFRNDIRDLIQYDFAASQSANIGRARTRGLEAGLSAPLGAHLSARISYTLLEATDLGTGLALIRRPKNRGSIDLAWNQNAWQVAGTAILTGTRADQDSATFARVEDPGYARFDLYATYRLGALAPFVRLENATDRRYEEVDGYPAPRRRVAAGISATF